MTGEGEKPYPSSVGRCYRCSASLAFVERIGRRDLCEGCGAYLHCCRNCTFYEPGCYNECREPQAERQVDKEAGNFCEYFTLGAADAENKTKPGPRDQLERLFGKKTK